VTGGQPWNCGQISDRGKIIVFSPKHPDQLWIHPTSHSGVQGTISLGVMQPWYEADHLALSMAEVKHEWSCTPVPMSFYGAHSDNFTFTFY